MSQLRQALEELSGAPVALDPPSDEQVLDRLSGRIDPAHAVVLRGLLDLGEAPGLAPRADLAGVVRTRFEALRTDVHDRLRSVDNDIPQRFSAGTLGERLRETGWYRESLVGGWETTGRGSRKDLRAVFLLACRDLSSELERILVQCQSRCDHLDDLVARQWLSLEGQGNGARILACLAEGLRPEESERRKAWRVRVPLEAEARFCAALTGRWERRSAPDLAGLHRLVSEPWGAARGCGFTAFAHRFVHFARATSDAMVWHSTSRWSLLLGGLPQEPLQELRSASAPAPEGAPSRLPSEPPEVETP